MEDCSITLLKIFIAWIGFNILIGIGVMIWIMWPKKDRSFSWMNRKVKYQGKKWFIISKVGHANYYIVPKLGHRGIWVNRSKLDML